MRGKRVERPVRDDAEAQPESGYPSGRLPTEPSAAPKRDETAELRARAGSESEFGSAPLPSADGKGAKGED